MIRIMQKKFGTETTSMLRVHQESIYMELKSEKNDFILRNIVKCEDDLKHTRNLETQTFLLI